MGKDTEIMFSHRKRFWFWMVVLFVAVVFPGFETVKAAERRDGWRILGERSFYYQDGRKVTGWFTIQDYDYYFNNKGRLITNGIGGNKKAGFDYVDSRGRRVTDPTMRTAVALVRSITAGIKDPEEKLEKCFWYLVRECIYRAMDYEGFTAQDLPSYADYMFRVRAGNCLGGATAMAYMAKALGYDVRICWGKVSSYNPVPDNDHAWAEIRKDGKYYVYDVSMQRVYQAQLHNIIRREYPYAVACEHCYYLKTGKGDAYWKG